MAKKVKVATTWLQSCSGCHISLLDLHEELLDILGLIQLDYSPLVDVKEIPRVDVGIVEGSVANEENEAVLKKMREQSKTLVALGTCACMGGIPGFRNLFHRMDVLKRSYIETESTDDGRLPRAEEVPKLLQAVKPLNQLVEVDYELPGCPPLPQAIKSLLVALVKGEEFSLPSHNLCEECDRIREAMLNPQRGFVTETVHAYIELEEIDQERCFLEQGVLCMGPATREGCKARCIHGNFPCRGCMGPTPDALEQGAKMINALASILPAGALMFLEDVVGAGYRYSVPVSVISGLKRGGGEGG